MLHKVKLLSGFYQAVIDGIKPFEIRYNDRNYRKGDDIIFNEWKDDAYTGRLCCAVIKDVFDIGFLMPGYVAFTFQLLGNFEEVKKDIKTKKVKEHIPSHKEQCVAAEILTEFMFCDTMEDIHKTWDTIYKQYALCDDPFTHTPCSSKEAIENQLEYEKQIMIEKYGHCDGLE